MNLLWIDTILNPRRGRRRLAAMLAACAALLALVAPAARAGTANAGLPGAGANPIAAVTWGAPHDDDLWGAYASASGAQRTLLGKIALLPRALWLGSWWRVNQVRAETALTIADTQNGNPNVLTQFVTFELNPWEQKKAGGGVWYGTPNGNWNVTSDEAWYRNMAAGIGSARAMVIVQADLPFELKTRSTAPARINTYAARVLSAGSRTTVYIDAGTFGWLTAAHDAALLVRNGIRYARGFSLDDTDYDPTSVEDLFGARVIAALAKLGVTGKHFIVDTDENGQPYKPDQVAGRTINDAPACHGRLQTVCQRTGIPPTTNVASSVWHLGGAASKAAAQYCDGYVWSGRPWDFDAGPFDPQNAQWLAANGKY
jgi:hypothetical protein